MHKVWCCLLAVCVSLFFYSKAEAKTIYSCNWQTGVEVPFKYTSYITTGKHGVIIEGKQSGIGNGRAVNYALVIDRIWTDRLISFKNVYGNTEFKIKLNAPKGTKCRIRIFIYGGGLPKGSIKVSQY